MLSDIKKPLDHTKISFNKIGVLIVNLGTPENTDYFSIRKYLKQFLNDRRVIDVFRPLWWIILNLIILSFRPSKTGQAYKRIWHPIKGSPLKYLTTKQSKKLTEKFKIFKIVQIDYAMRYGNPSIRSRLDNLFNLGCTKILIMPLYPQYSASTTATVLDEVHKWMLNKRWQPSLRTVPPWYDNKDYIQSICNSINKSFKKNGEPETLLISFHGVPKRYLILGDPYHCHCQKTARLIEENLKWPQKNIFVTFQSRFGSEPWLKPYTDEKIIELAKNGTTNLSIVSPGFVSDCLETLDEIKNEMKEIFYKNGGKSFHYIDCLNDSEEGINLLKNLIISNLSGWIDLNKKL